MDLEDAMEVINKTSMVESVLEDSNEKLVRLLFLDPCLEFHFLLFQILGNSHRTKLCIA